MGGWNVRELFEQAFELPPGEREAYLSEACGGDDELRAEVEALLASSTADDYLEPPAPGRVAGFLEARLAAALAGERIGGFRITGVLASGGMGTVFEAEQESPRRRVALKMVRLGLDSPAAVRRFRYEAEVLGRLRHPGIAQVYGSGVHARDGAELPWFAMELVENGRSLLEYSAANRLDERARIELLARFCDAVQHGHQKGVIHRDLKPSNLLVDDGGHPKVIDFGLARAVDEDGDAARSATLTQAGAVVGTLRYMAPEQLAGDAAKLDTRCDVYALGVVLCELIGGHPPYALEGRGLTEVARAIRDEPPVLPRALRGDLATIAAKALEKDPARRYASAAALAEDLRRYLAREPVLARPPSSAYQLRMFARRHRVLVGAAAAVLVVSVVGAGVSLRFGAEARAQRDDALAARGRSATLFETLLDRSLASAFDHALALRDVPNAEPVARDMLTGAVADLELLERQAAGDPTVRVQLGRAYTRLGDVQGNPAHPNLGDWDGARASYERALAIARAVSADAPEDAGALELLALAHRRLGETLLDFDLERALEHNREAVAASERALALDPTNAARRAALAAAHLRLGVAHKRAKRFAEAEPHLVRNSELMATIAAAEPSRSNRGQLGLARFNLAGLYLESDRDAEAVEHYGRAATVFQGLLDDDPLDAVSRKNLGLCLLWSGYSLRELGELSPGAVRLADAAAVFQELIDRDAGNAQLYPLHAWALEHHAVLWTLRAEEMPPTAPARRDAWSAARDLFAQSRDVWRAAEAAGLLHPAHAGSAERMQDYVEACDEELAPE